MAQYWMIPDTPDEQLSLRDLARRISEGQLSESMWVVHSETLARQQIYDIPGLANAVRKLQTESAIGVSTVAVEDKSNTNRPQQQVTSPARSDSIVRMILVTKPKTSWAIASLGLILGSLGTSYYSNLAMLKFPPPLGSPMCRVLPVIGEVIELDFWVVQGCLILAAIAAFQMAILLGVEKRSAE